MTGVIHNTTNLNAAATTDAVQVPGGMLLVGLSLPELTSTTFTITHATQSNGTFRTLKDPLGIYGTAGNAITFTIGATSLGLFQISPIVIAPINSWFKIVFDSAETASIGLIFREIA